MKGAILLFLTIWAYLCVSSSFSSKVLILIDVREKEKNFFVVVVNISFVPSPTSKNINN